MTPAELLTDWIRLKHRGQVINRSNEAYFEHLHFVAETVRDATVYGYEIGLCHDLLEDTQTTPQELQNALQSFGYADLDACYITGCVIELTDVFTKKAYPNLSKALRKLQEAARLSTISPTAQTIKYADLIYNIKWVLKYNPYKALPYLKKKQLLLTALGNGDEVLRQQAMELLVHSMQGLSAT